MLPPPSLIHCRKATKCLTLRWLRCRDVTSMVSPSERQARGGRSDAWIFSCFTLCSLVLTQPLSLPLKLAATQNACADLSTEDETKGQGAIFLNFMYSCTCIGNCTAVIRFFHESMHGNYPDACKITNQQNKRVYTGTIGTCHNTIHVPTTPILPEVATTPLALYHAPPHHHHPKCWRRIVSLLVAAMTTLYRSRSPPPPPPPPPPGRFLHPAAAT